MNIGQEHMELCHSDGSECKDGCDAQPVRLTATVTAMPTTDEAQITLYRGSVQEAQFKAYKAKHWGHGWLLMHHNGTKSDLQDWCRYLELNWDKDDEAEAGWDGYFAHAAGYVN